MLVVSHFYDDHANGLDTLMRGITTRNIFIPYFAPIERLIMAVRRETLPAWYYTFLRDPVSFFFSKGVERVIVIGGEKGERGPAPKNISPPSKRIDINLPDDGNLKRTIRHNEHWERFIKAGKLLIKNHSGYVTGLGKWVFRFFNYEVKRKSDSLKAYLKAEGINPDTPDEIKRAITHAPTREKIRRHYERAFSEEFNGTSLVTYHGPTDDLRRDLYVTCERGLSFNDCPHLHSSNKKDPCHYVGNRMGQLLTGGIGLNRKRVYRELKTHYNNYFDTVFLSQIPRHGSRKNWNKDILNDLKECSHWVASSGCPSFFGHPHSMVVLDILRNERCFCWSNQHDRFFIE